MQTATTVRHWSNRHLSAIALLLCSQSGCGQLLGYPDSAFGPDASPVDASFSDAGWGDDADASGVPDVGARTGDAAGPADAFGGGDAAHLPDAFGSSDAADGRDASGVFDAAGSPDGADASRSADAGPTCDGAPWDAGTDPDNCGRCGHSCLGGACASGVCQPVPLATGNPNGLVVDGVDVYWTDGNGGTVMHTLVDGGGTETLFYGQASPWGIATDGVNLYWANNAAGSAGGAIVRGARSGGTPTTLAGSITTVAYVAIDGENVYFCTGDPSASLVRSVPLDGGAVVTLATGESWANKLVVDGVNAYWTVRSAVMRCAKKGCGGTPVTLATIPSGNIGGGLDVRGGQVYFSAANNGGQVEAVPDDGGAAPVTVASSQPYPAAITVDDSGVYWVNTDNGSPHGSVAYRPVDGGATVTLATEQAQPGIAIVTDSTAVYWTNNTGAGSLMKVAKP